MKEREETMLTKRWRNVGVLSGCLYELVDGDTEDAADGEEDEGDEDDDGGVAPEVVAELVVGRQLQEAAAEERPGEETLFSRTNPGL